VVSFTPLPLYPRGRIPQYPLGRKLGDPQNRSGRHEERSLAPTGTRTPSPRQDCAIPALSMSDTSFLITKPINRCKFVNHSVADGSVAVYEEEPVSPLTPPNNIPPRTLCLGKAAVSPN
jgi:hypothetical protein